MQSDVAIKTRIGKQTGVECRNAHHRRRVGQLSDHRVEVEFRQKYHPPPDPEQHVGCHEKPMRVKDRQRMQKHIVAGEPPCLGQGIGIGEQVVVAQHCAL